MSSSENRFDLPLLSLPLSLRLLLRTLLVFLWRKEKQKPKRLTNRGGAAS